MRRLLAIGLVVAVALTAASTASATVRSTATLDATNGYTVKIYAFGDDVVVAA